MSFTPSIETIRAAADRFNGVGVRTPLLESPLLNDAAGRRVLVKAECLQKVGAFKFRGAWSRLSAMSPEERKAGVIAYSSGNHAQGVALAAKLLGAPAVIIMPNDAPELKRANTAAYGAEVVLYDRWSESREEIGAAIAASRGLTLVKPYDDPWVISGQGTVGLEIAEQAKNAGVAKAEVLIPCGGGGLASGVALALEAEAPGLRPRTVEPKDFDDVARSLASGQRVSNDPGARSICDAIVTPEPGELTFPILCRLAGPGLAVSDEEALGAMRRAFLDLKITLEPGGAVALAAALFRPDSIEGDAVIVVATGGNVDTPVFARAMAMGQ